MAYPPERKIAMASKRSKTDEATALRLVVEGTASETGPEFFRALVRNLARTLDTLGAWVTEYDPHERRLRALGMWLAGDHVEDYEYAIEGTACATVVESRELIHIPERLIELYPQDGDLVPLRAVSYLGVPLLDLDGNVLGHLSVLDDKPMPLDPRAVSLFEIFAARATAEHRRLKAERELRAREEQLSLLLETAMDAILVLDRNLSVVRNNAAAERLFGCPAAKLAGSVPDAFLVKDSAERFRVFVREVSALPRGRQHLWIPENLVARRRDGSVFPAEITLSRFESDGDAFHTVILRNADERLEAERRIELLTQETEYLKEAVRDLPGHGEMIGCGEGMRKVFDAVKRVAATDATVLITGETGTGKELVARSIHRASRRSERPLVLVNCAAIPENLIESEFFGHERGAFTGATAKREGRFSLADGGTLFLDEVGELPLGLQAKLLRVLQEGEFEPLGGARTRKVDVRVIAATNRNLREMVSAGEFREDLYFRLNVFPIHLPPLRERGRDIAQLASLFTEKLARRLGKRIAPLDDGQIERLRAYAWPGNVRELQNVIERAIILASGRRPEIERAFDGTSPHGASRPEEPPPPQPGPERILTAAEMEELERSNLLRALEATAWKVSGENGAARLLGVPPTTLTSRMKALGLRRSGEFPHRSKRKRKTHENS